jgi:CubicO group peptidase (beta-lactamase class C family)
MPRDVTQEGSMKLAKHIAVVAAIGCMQGCTAVRTAVHNFADLDDHAIFSNRLVETAPRADPLRGLARLPRFMAELQVPDEDGVRRPLDEYLERTRTAAFVVVRDDRIVYERYARGYDEHSPLNSFSIAKTIVATLVGMAVAEGRISSLDATVADYRPDLAHTAYGGVRLRHLLSMSSGVGDAASLLPGRAQYYYGDDLRDVVAHGVAEASPGERWQYSEADVQVLGFVLEAAVGKSLSRYLAEKLWKPLRMEAPALWALDREGGNEKAFCCVSARARDFARFGRLFLDRGHANGAQLIPAAWSDPAAFPGVQTLDRYMHRHLWWFPEGTEGDYYAYGHNGQYLYVNPAARTVIVKFSETNRQDPVGMFRAVSAALKPAARVAELDRLVAPSLASR